MLSCISQIILVFVYSIQKYLYCNQERMKNTSAQNSNSRVLFVFYLFKILRAIINKQMIVKTDKKDQIPLILLAMVSFYSSDMLKIRIFHFSNSFNSSTTLLKSKSPSLFILFSSVALIAIDLRSDWQTIKLCLTHKHTHLYRHTRFSLFKASWVRR